MTRHVTRYVLDASMALGWLVDQPTPALALRFRSMLIGQVRAIVPFFWHLEIANGLTVAERRGLISITEAEAFIGQLESLLLSVIDVRSGIVPVRDAYAKARALQLAPYDYAYLALAKEEGVGIATLDQKLLVAAERAGVPVFH